MRQINVLPAVIFFVSGCACLIFEILCARKLALAVGSTVFSASATVAAFLFGLGLGSYFGGRIALRSQNLLRLFALAEIGAGIGCLVALSTVGMLPHWLAQTTGGGPFVTLALAFVILVPPCFFMGASLPILCQHYMNQSDGRFISILASLYAINTFGAFVGVIITDFFLVQRIGIWNSGLLAVGLYFLVAFLAAWSSVKVPPSSIPEPNGRSSDVHTSPVIALVALVGAGVCSLTYQILWTRTLTFFNGNDVFAFSLTLGIYLLGIVVGSLILTGLSAKITMSRRALLGLCLAGLSVTGFVSLFATALVPDLRGFLFEFGIRDPWLQFAGCLLVIGPSALLIGLVFPLASDLLLASNVRVSDTVGRAYLANSVGSAFGAIVAGLVLLPNLGLQGSWTVAASVTMALALLLLWPVKRWNIVGVGAGLLLASTLALTPGDALLKILYGEKYPNILFQADDHYGSVAFAREWVPMRQEFNEILYIDAFNMAGNNVIAQRYTTCLSLLPILLHKDPKSVLIVCLGLGNTAFAALSMEETETVDCVELSSKVPEAISYSFLGPKVLKDPKFNLIIGDGRSHLLRTSKRYDIISAEPPPPMNAGVVNLYSREYYELCRDRLNPGGIAVQWLPVFQMSPFEAKIIIAAFQSVFPNTYLWQGGELQLILLGSMEPIEVDLAQLEKRVAHNTEFLESRGLADPYKLAGLYLVGSEELRAYTQGVPLLTDDWPRIQYPDLNWQPDVHFFFFQARDLDIKADPEQAERLAQAQSLARIERSFLEYRRIGLGELSRMELARTYLESRPGDEFFITLARASQGWREIVEGDVSRTPQAAGAWQELARLHFLHSSFPEALSAAQNAVELQAEISLADFMIPMILARGGAAQTIPDGEALATKAAEDLQAQGQGMWAQEFQYLKWLLQLP